MWGRKRTSSCRIKHLKTFKKHIKHEWMWQWTSGGTKTLTWPRQTFWFDGVGLGSSDIWTRFQSVSGFCRTGSSNRQFHSINHNERETFIKGVVMELFRKCSSDSLINKRCHSWKRKRTLKSRSLHVRPRGTFSEASANLPVLGVCSFGCKMTPALGRGQP